MVRYLPLFLFLFASLLNAQLNFEEEGTRERNHYGMSQAEWRAYKESGMSIGELEELILCGITYSEYQTRPWLSLGISRKTWIEDRCKGLGDQDVKAFHAKSPRDYSIVLAFLIPGSYHFRTGQHATASCLLGADLISWGCFFLLPKERTISNTDNGGVTVTKQKQAVFMLGAIATGVVSAALSYKQQNTKPMDESLSIGIMPQRDGVLLSVKSSF